MIVVIAFELFSLLAITGHHSFASRHSNPTTHRDFFYIKISPKLHNFLVDQRELSDEHKELNLITLQGLLIHMLFPFMVLYWVINFFMILIRYVTYGDMVRLPSLTVILPIIIAYLIPDVIYYFICEAIMKNRNPKIIVLCKKDFYEETDNESNEQEGNDETKI